MRKIKTWLMLGFVIGLVGILLFGISAKGCLWWRDKDTDDKTTVSGSSSGVPLGQWTAITTTNAPSPRVSYSVVWTGNEMIIWGGRAPGPVFFNTGFKYNPISDTWTTITTDGAPVSRTSPSAVWTGSEMIIWGGYILSGGFYRYNDGSKYNPLLDTWTTITTDGAPVSRSGHSAIWTGNEMIIWGGYGQPGLGIPDTDLYDGAKYNPISDTWTTITTDGAPVSRSGHSAVWTGQEMIICGVYPGGYLDSGKRYNPISDTWIAITSTNAPALISGSTVWTGSEMIVWGNADGSKGAKYNPVSDTWTSVTTNGAPQYRTNHSAVWTGNEMIIWGGSGYGVGTDMNDGARYNPSTNTWKLLPTVDLSARIYHTAIWTGSEMIIWGGTGQGPYPDYLPYIMNDGGRYKP